jgi:predicted nucleotidyltransferase
MDLEPDRVSALKVWAANNESVQELWLFGSRAKGTATPKSDVDLALIFMQETDNTNWALAKYIEEGDLWRKQLERIVGLPISMGAIEPGIELYDEVMATGVCLWSRANVV